jgi:hypothetical protein
VDYAGAERNLDAEVRADGRLLTFDELRDRARQAWRTELSSVDLSDASADDRAVFYTSLYHVLLQPLTGNDVDGRYLGSTTRSTVRRLDIPRVLVAVGHLPDPEPTAGTAAPGPVRRHRQVRADHSRAGRVAAAVGVCQPGDQYDDR